MTDIDAPDDRLHAPPRAVRYEPSPSAPLPVAGDTGTVVLLLAGAVDRRWAAEAAVGLAAGWARGGRRVVLADLHLEDPLLHELTGSRNLEGVVDVFLYGASIARSARPVSGQGFFLIPAGTYEADADAIYRHPRWGKIVAGFHDANAALVLFAPAGGADVAAISEWIDRVILLGEPGAAAGLESLMARGVEPETMLVPPGSSGDASPPARSAPALWTGPGGAQPVKDDTREMMIPPTPKRAPPRRRRQSLYSILAILAAAAILALAGYLLARYRPDLVPWARAAAAPVEEEAREAPPSSGSRIGYPAPYSVQVKAFTSLDAAVAQVEEERARFEGQPFFVSPEEIQGILYYKVLAGLAADTVQATRLRQALVDAGSVEDEEAVGSWTLIQFTPLAFDLGEYATRAAAEERADSLAGRDVPSYMVAMPYSDGSRRWQLYAGAYRDSLSADAMRQRLVAAGVRPTLVARIAETGAAPR